MDIYEVILKVPQDKLSSVMGALLPEVQLINCRPMAVEEPPPPPKQKYAGGKRFKGIFAPDLILQALQDGKRLTIEEISKVLTSHNPPFSSNTAQSTCYQMRRKGLIERDDSTNRWFLSKKKK